MKAKIVKTVLTDGSEVYDVVVTPSSATPKGEREKIIIQVADADIAHKIIDLIGDFSILDIYSQTD